PRASRHLRQAGAAQDGAARVGAREPELVRLEGGAAGAGGGRARGYAAVAGRRGMGVGVGIGVGIAIGCRGGAAVRTSGGADLPLAAVDGGGAAQAAVIALNSLRTERRKAEGAGVADHQLRV